MNRFSAPNMVLHCNDHGERRCLADIRKMFGIKKRADIRPYNPAGSCGIILKRIEDNKRRKEFEIYNFLPPEIFFFLGKNGHGDGKRFFACQHYDCQIYKDILCPNLPVERHKVRQLRDAVRLKDVLHDLGYHKLEFVTIWGFPPTEGDHPMFFDHEIVESAGIDKILKIGWVDIYKSHNMIVGKPQSYYGIFCF